LQDTFLPAILTFRDTDSNEVACGDGRYA